jgi:Abortive infection alpha
MPLPLEKLLEMIPKETIEKAYEDALSGPAKEVGKLATDVAKTARLILAPLQITATYQDRFEAMLRRIRDRVPEERQIEAPPELVGPTVEHMRYVDDRSELWKMYEELLTQSLDSGTVDNVHPSFALIISQLSRDEAMILYRLRGGQEFDVEDTLDLDQAARRFVNRHVTRSDLPLSDLHLPDKLDLYYAHLESLSLVTWPVINQEPIRDAANIQTGIRRQSKLMLTDFGKLFVAACIPENGFSMPADEVGRP